MGEPTPDQNPVGLCADCRYMRAVRSDRGAVFYQCQRAASDPSFPRYPILPMLFCRGYESRETLPARDDSP